MGIPQLTKHEQLRMKRVFAVIITFLSCFISVQQAIAVNEMKKDQNALAQIRCVELNFPDNAQFTELKKPLEGKLQRAWFLNKARPNKAVLLAFKIKELPEPVKITVLESSGMSKFDDNAIKTVQNAMSYGCKFPVDTNIEVRFWLKDVPLLPRS